MAEYRFREIEKHWQEEWRRQGVYKTENISSNPKYYVLDMFPYPSGAGLHVGHPLGYIASDICSRFMRLKGYNVLHPMGYDAFGLPAEQYAIQTGQHPAVTTTENINRYREQLDKLGLSFDWSREVRTCDPSYYKWTQWIFIRLFNAWYNPLADKAEPIDTLVSAFENNGFKGSDDSILSGNIETELPAFTADEWKAFDEETQQRILLNFRLAYLSEAYVNWCPQLGTVLANEEVKDGFSERGGYPVERKLMKQWSMRISAYSERLLKDLETLDWSESIKETQRNWIGKSEGSSVRFKLENAVHEIEVFTTRPDTIFGVSFLTLAPEHELALELATEEQRNAVEEYIKQSSARTERERMADVKKISGVFTGAYVLHPFTNKKVPVWLGDYVLAGYGTGAVMGVPAHDSRDHAFALHFNLPILPVVSYPESHDIKLESWDAKSGTLINSDFLNGLDVKDAIKKAISEIEKLGAGKGKTNYRLRDAVFGRQRYWGEPIPVYYKGEIPYALSDDELPLTLPEIDKFLPTESGEPPLARAKDWKYKGEYEYELSTMPGWAGSSWYFLRYMDPFNEKEPVSQEIAAYWKNVDLYIGGSEHATGHLLYVRFWTKFLYDLGLIPENEPAKKLVNQGMIQGRSLLAVYGFGWEEGQKKYLSYNNYQEVHERKYPGFFRPGFPQFLHIPVKYADKYDRLFKDQFKKIQEEEKLYKDINLDEDVDWELDERGREFILLSAETEKMSKSKLNVVNPDDIVQEYGADTLRLYEMFLGPLELSKPWNTNGIEGVFRFLNKLWRLFHDDKGSFNLSEDKATAEEQKVLHKAIKKAADDIAAFSFNTSVSAFMITVNELATMRCNKREILEPLLIILSPFAPHICEELWQLAGHKESIVTQSYPEFNAAYLVENSFSYPVSINGKVRVNIEFPLDAANEEMERHVLNNEIVLKWLEGRAPKKVIIVKGRIVNVVV